MALLTISIITILATLAAAAPQSPASIFARGNCDSNFQGGVYVCPGPFWGTFGDRGECEYVDLSSGNDYGRCKTLTNEWICSFGPSPGLNCVAWTDTDCGKGFQAEYVDDISCPGYDDLFLTGLNNRIRSFKCDKV